MRHINQKVLFVMLAAHVCFVTRVLAEEGISIATAVKDIMPNVVRVTPMDESNESDRYATGFIIKNEKYLVTSYHVINDCDKVKITLGNEEEFWSKTVVVYDAQLDLAVLEIDQSEISLPDSINGIPFGDSDIVEIGDAVYTVGNPLGWDYSVSNGIISQKRKAFNQNIFQITVAVSFGSSGGPLINDTGTVIGVVSSTVLFGQNLNFAVPTNSIKKKLESTKIKKTNLTEIREIEKKEKEKRLVEMINENFTLKREPHMYQMYVPRD